MGEEKQYRTTGKKRTPRKANKNVVTLDVETGEIEWGRGNYDGGKKGEGTKRDIVTITFRDILKTVDIDLKYTHSTIGRTIIRQKIGCPIGGKLSGSYANIYCAKDEYEFIEKMKAEGIDEKRIQAVRQMDDLVMWISYEKGNEKTKEEAKKIIKEMYDIKEEKTSVYKGGLNLEIEPIGWKNNKKKFIQKFAGTKVIGYKNIEDLYIRTSNKNIGSIENRGKQKFPRYPGKSTYIHDQVRQGVIIGTMIRTETQNTYEKHKVESMIDDIKEFESIGYEIEYIMRVINKIRRREGWEKRIERIKENFKTNKKKGKTR